MENCHKIRKTLWLSLLFPLPLLLLLLLLPQTRLPSQRRGSSCFHIILIIPIDHVTVMTPPTTLIPVMDLMSETTRTILILPTHIHLAMMSEMVQIIIPTHAQLAMMSVTVRTILPTHTRRPMIGVLVEIVAQTKLPTDLKRKRKRPTLTTPRLTIRVPAPASLIVKTQ